VVAWYETWNGESSIYLVSQAQKGWTDRIDSRLVDRKVWLDGPHGKPYDSGSCDLSGCDTVLLVAEESGIFAHLLILKSLVESFKFGTTKTRRVVLMWNTTGVYFDSIQRWFTQLIVDTNEDPRVSALLRCQQTPLTVP
jgi:NAD(P)H-flavin reductase